MIGNAPRSSAFVGTAGQLKVGSINEETFLLGKSFSFEDYFVFDTAEEKLIVFDPALYLGPQIFVEPVMVAASSGPILLDFYYDFIGASDGTLLSASNRLLGGSAPLSTLRENPTPTVEDVYGTRFAGDMVPSTGVAAPNAKGAASAGGLLFQLNPTVKTAINIKNLDGDDVYVQLKITWYEI